MSIPEIEFTSTLKDPPPIRLQEAMESVTVTLMAFMEKCKNAKTKDYSLSEEVEVKFDLQKSKYPALSRC